MTVSIIVIAVFLSFYIRQSNEPPTVTIEIERPQQPEIPVEDTQEAIQYPVPDIVVEREFVKPLPKLDNSDGPVEEEFNALVRNSQLSELLLFKTFIRNFVVIIDNLTAKILPQKYSFFNPPTGSFMVIVSEDDKIYLNPDNYQRYSSFVHLINTLDLEKLTNIYIFLYPLFQEAYEELGYPDSYFNDRLIEVFAVLLQTPDVQDPVELVQPTVYYKFANPELEALSTGQKLLIRIGPENAKMIKSRVQNLLQRIKVLDSSN